ncbi:SMP-30/gluconolactonase/LRE family protein [Hymenobacter terrenus]|uniref:SMP-30/gluconolactonase/LRE family protein n=1 Tax=Hymenobacter terrenus TaxID=1629124 RepID=UPI000619B6FD|nr:hypothetical protein [Hymenobacter terrenus]
MNTVVSLQLALGIALLLLAWATFARRTRFAFRPDEFSGRSWPHWVMGGSAALCGLAAVATVSVPFLSFFVAVAAAVLLGTWWIIRRSGWLVGLLLAALALGGLQPLGLRVLALPKADELPQRLGNTRILATYAPGEVLESVRLDARGNFFLTVNKELDLATGDASRVTAKILRRTPAGQEQVWLTLPRGAIAGVLAFGADSTLYCTGGGARRGVWRITAPGHATLFASLPVGAWPNGLALGPDGYLYVADAALATIWRVDPRTGSTTKAIEHDLLRPRTFLALAPGANGLHFRGNTLFVTVSDRGTVLTIPWKPTGQLGVPTVLATGVPADDFAIDVAGNLYVTTHPYNTVVQIRASGERAVVAGVAQAVAGATDAAFGTRRGDESTLYIVTDGGAFAGTPNPRGTLVQLRLQP